MGTSDPTPAHTYGTDRGALVAARKAAAQHVYDAECALHTALQAARGANTGAEAGQCDRWVAAAYAHLHTANVEYAAATAALDRPTPLHRTGEATDGGTARAA
jgi:hypothetical protein